jgi:hypothetical protein
MSFCTNPVVAAKKHVIAPKQATTANAMGACSKIGEHRAIINTPAVTIVAAWIRAETGVGPSIASGNQVCNPNCADLPTQPMNKRIDTNVRLSTSKLQKNKLVPARSGAQAKAGAKLTVWQSEKRAIIPSASPTSPILFISIAFIEDLEA